MNSRRRERLVAEHRDECSLLECLAAGDQAAFDALYLEHADAVARFAWTLTRDDAGAGELVQDSFTTLWKKPAAVRLVNGSVLPWLMTTCRHHAQNLRRRERRWQQMAELDENSSPPDEQGAGELATWVMDSLSHLAEVDRQVCVLVMLRGHTYREAAAALDISEASVGKRLHRSRRHIRKVVQP